LKNFHKLLVHFTREDTVIISAPILKPFQIILREEAALTLPDEREEEIRERQERIDYGAGTTAQITQKTSGMRYDPCSVVC
jgi:hypothetical protein